jgi:hypothetical protein
MELSMRMVLVAGLLTLALLIAIVSSVSAYETAGTLATSTTTASGGTARTS